MVMLGREHECMADSNTVVRFDHPQIGLVSNWTICRSLPARRVYRDGLNLAVLSGVDWIRDNTKKEVWERYMRYRYLLGKSDLRLRRTRRLTTKMRLGMIA